jgi:hypothetical protein
VRSIGLPSWIERALGRRPRPVPPNVFAVRRRELRFAAFSRSDRDGSGLALTEFHSLPLAEGIFGGGPLAVPVGESDALAASVRALVARVTRPVREATVVLPDAWTRSMVIELGDLPEDPLARLDVLRFRVKKMVPYRVEDLRLDAVPLGALGAAGSSDGAGGAAQAFLTLANMAVCTMVESAFASCGIRVGQLSGATLATLQALNRPATASGLMGLALVDADGFSLVLVHAGVPVVWRQKGFTEGLADVDRARLLTAELRLTRTFLAERYPAEALETLYLAAPQAVEPFWLEVLGQGLECSPTRLAVEHLGLAVEGFGDAFMELAPLAGAASREVA